MAHVVVFRMTDWPGDKSAVPAWDLPASLAAAPGYLYAVAARRAVAPAVKAIPEIVPGRWVEQRALARAGRIADALLRIPIVSDFVYEGRHPRRYTYGFHTNATLEQLRDGWDRAGVEVRPWRALLKK